MQPSLNTPRTFGALIRQYRVAASLTQDALGERAHLSATTIAALERGRRLTPRPGTVLLLAEALQLTPTEEADLIAAATGSPSRGSNIAADTRSPSPGSNTSGLPIASTSPIGIDRELRDINGAHGSTRLRKRTLAETKSTVGEVLGQIEQQLFVGRKVELRTFVDWLDAPALHKPILEVSGPGGVGKSVLLSAYRRHAVAAGRKVVLADGRGFPSTEDGLIRALGGTTLADVIARSRAEPGLVLMLDSFEQLRGLSRFLLDRLLPELDASVRVVIASRLALSELWGMDDLWHKLVQPIALGGFSEAESVAYLAGRGLAQNATISAEVLRVAGRHPLALSLAADLVDHSPQGLRGFIAHTEWPLVLRGLVERLLENEDPDVRSLLEAAAVVRQFDEALLASMTGPALGSAAFRALCRLSAVRTSDERLMLHDEVRHIVAQDLRLRDPDRFARLRWRALAAFRERGRTASDTERAWLIAERLYLWGNALTNLMLFQDDRPDDVWIDDPRSDDVPRLLEITRSWFEYIFARSLGGEFGPYPMEALQTFIEQTFSNPGVWLRVARGRDGQPIGLWCALRVYRGSIDLLLANPMFAPPIRAILTVADIRALPANPEDARLHFLIMIALADQDNPIWLQTQPNAVQSALSREMFSLFARGDAYLVTLPSPGVYSDYFTALGFVEIPGLDFSAAWRHASGIRWAGYRLDLRGVGVEAWIEQLIRQEIGAPPAESQHSTV